MIIILRYGERITKDLDVLAINTTCVRLRDPEARLRDPGAAAHVLFRADKRGMLVDSYISLDNLNSLLKCESTP